MLNILALMQMKIEGEKYGQVKAAINAFVSEKKCFFGQFPTRTKNKGSKTPLKIG